MLEYRSRAAEIHGAYRSTQPVRGDSARISNPERTRKIKPARANAL
jgi:hypothetical protein